MRRCRDADTRQRYRIVLDLADGQSSVRIAGRRSCARATVSRVAARYRAEGEAGLYDHRRGRGAASAALTGALARLVHGSPQDYGWSRPTWTQELLVRQLEADTGRRVSRTTLIRLLRRLRARRGRPRPVVCCPWPAAEREARLATLRALVAHPPPGSVVLFSDEVDIHLNPNIGPDWMLPGEQKLVVTPGKNAKRYLAGALNRETGLLIWVSGERKTSALFLALLRQLLVQYPAAATICVILDNYGIHRSKAVAAFLADEARRVRLHFLPSYCPQANAIEREWLDLHAAVTRNHRCTTITELLANVDVQLEKRNVVRRLSRLAA
jgi:transposase